jgi:tetratricopeptide (TPR) repeat protein
MNFLFAILLSSVPPAIATPAVSSAINTPAALNTAQPDEVDRLIAAGRAELDGGRAEQAQVLFEEADAKTGSDMRTRVWVLRSWIDQGRYNDAFDQMEMMEKAGAKGAAVDYIFGMGSYRRALDNMAAGGSSTVQLALVDAANHLKGATDGDGDLFDDAFTPLAHAAWLAHEPTQLELAINASERGTKARPKSHNASYVRGLVLAWQTIEAAGREDEKTKQAAAKKGLTAFSKAAKLLPEDKSTVANRAEYHLQAATLALWIPDKDLAAREYAQAMGCDPSNVDFGVVWGALAGGENGVAFFVTCLEDAKTQYIKRWGDKTKGDATLLWWLGYAQTETGAYEEADKNLEQAVQKWPAYENAYLYQALARYRAENYVGAAEALEVWWGKNPASLVAMIKGNPELHIGIVYYTQGKCYAAGPTGVAQAAVCAEILCGVEPTKWERWNDLGLFSRDSGEVLKRSSKKKEDQARAEDYFERSLEAYRKGMDLAPEQAGLYNDAAVILHYYLDREFEQAMIWYSKSQNLAVKALTNPDLKDFERTRTEIAKRDSADNLKKIRKLIEKRKKTSKRDKKTDDGAPLSLAD